MASTSEFDLGFLGGGQLARMSIMAAQRMGLRCVSLDPGPETPASQLAPAIQGALDDPQAISSIARRAGKVTLENEFIPAAALREGIALAGRDEACLLPGIDALAIVQDKLRQRQALAEAGVPSPPAFPIQEDSAAVDAIGFPMVLKARFGGYDGKGTRFAKTPEEFEAYRQCWEGGNWLAEAHVQFRRELATMVYISADGGHKGCFPTMVTVQTAGVCDLVYSSPDVPQAESQAVAIAAVEAVGGRGLFGVELFEAESGEISVNELAPRPHNSGHYSLDWGGASQFEQHVRMVMNLPPRLPNGGEVCMANLLGQPSAGDYRRGIAAALEGDGGLALHWYGKAESRPGRKMGHINAVGEHSVARAKAARQRFYEAVTSEGRAKETW